MQTLEKNIKGFNLLELIVVIVIMGIISATAYPNFQSWAKEREVQKAVTRIHSLIKNIYAQTEKGTFAYVQVKFTNTSSSLIVQTKGMTMDSLASKINDGTNSWYTNIEDRCSLQDSGYWDTDGTDDAAGDIKNFVNSISFDKVTTNFMSTTASGPTEGGDGDAVEVELGSSGGDNGGVGAVCFSRGGKFYEGAGQLEFSAGSPDGFIYICRRIEDGTRCPVTSPTVSATTKEEPGAGALVQYLRAVEWSRYGNFSTSKYGTNGWFQ